MRICLLLLVLASGCVSAQTIDAERSRFLSSPNGRTGTYAPYRLVVDGLGDVETLEVRSEAAGATLRPGVILTRQVAVGGVDHIEVVLPVYVGEGSQIVASVERSGRGVSLEPKLPLRRIEPDYARPYVAVFSNDPVYARVLVPNAPRMAVCDYFELADFFADWRLFDGYDALVIVNPDETRLPPGSQRAIAEFCSLGGCALIIGSFRLGEKDVDVPAPADPTVKILRGVPIQRFGYGPGAIYRIGFDELQRSRVAADVVVDAMRDHLWFGADSAPGGKPQSRVPPQQALFAPPLPPADAAPTPLFWGLGGGVLLLCLLAPLVSARVTKRAWPAQLVVLVGCSGLGGLALTQDRPLPAVELTAVVRDGQGEAASMRIYLLAENAWRDNLTVDLDGDDRALPRKVPGIARWHAWAIDRPLVKRPEPRGASIELNGGMVGDAIFRDFATRAHRGETQFSTNDAYPVAWWLDANAYRGRHATLAPVNWPQAGGAIGDARVIERGAIGVTDKREPG